MDTSPSITDSGAEMVALHTDVTLSQLQPHTGEADAIFSALYLS